MKTLGSLNLDSCCIHKKFLSRQDLFNRFFEINNYIDISTEPLEEITDRYRVSNTVLDFSKIYCSSIESKTKNIITFPLFWMYKRPLVDFNLVPNNSYKFITMNGATSKTRTEFISRLESAGVLNQGIYSLWPNVSLPSEKGITTHYDVKRSLPEEWYHSLYEFEIETCSTTGVPYLFISEKTFRPLLSGKPFLNYGYPGMYKKLKDYGFEFDTDLSFDENTNDRFDLYVKEVIRLINTPVSWYIVNKNKEVARELYNNSIQQFKTFKEELGTLKDMIYLDNEMIEYLNV
jgi:hypothetical protein